MKRSFPCVLRLCIFFIVAGIGRNVAQAQDVGQTSADCNSLKPQIYSKGCTSVCFGGSIMLDAGANYTSYEWSNGARGRYLVINSPELSGEYSCRVSLNSECSALSPAVSATVLPAANKPYIVQQGTLLSSTEASAYTWLYNGKPLVAADTRSIQPTSVGEYRVVINDTNGCSAISDPVVVSTLAINLPKQSRDARLRVYPNPSDGRITVQLISDFEGDIILRIHDVNGKEMLNTTWQHPKAFDTIFLDLSSAANGSYILSANDGTDVVTERIVVEH